MLLPRKQKTHDNVRLTPHVWFSKGPQGEVVDRSKTGTARFLELSKLSAKMVELSLQETLRDPTLGGAAPNKWAPGIWPFLATSAAAAHSHAQLPVSARKAGTIGQNTTLSGTLRPTPQPQPAQRQPRFPIAADLLQRTTPLLGRWSRQTAKILQFLVERISARVKILTHSKPLQRLKPAHAKLRVLMARASGIGAVIRKKLAKDYRCRDCGRQVGFRSHPRNLMERYILPLFLMRPVRCAECFRRDYRLFLTPVGRCSPHQDETIDHIHPNAA